MRRLTLLLTLCALSVVGGPAAALDWPHPGTQQAGRLLPAAQAFDFTGAHLAHGRVRLHWQIAPGYYLYRDRIHVRALHPAGVRMAPARMPPAVQVDEPGLGRVAVYHGALTVDYAVARDSPAPQVIEVEYQGCAEIGVCYQPQTHRFDLRHQD